MWIRRRLPEGHLNDDSRHLLEVSLGIIGTIAGLVLGLLVASATGSYNAQRSEVQDASSRIVLLDRLFAHYGPQADRPRRTLRVAVERALVRVWPQEHTDVSREDLDAFRAEALLDETVDLAPTNDGQRSLKPQLLGAVIGLGQERWLLFEQAESSTVSVPLLVLLIFWFTITFLGFGLFAPSNATVIVALGLCALAVAGAIFILLDLYKPFSGLLQISSATLRDALAQLGK